MQLRRIGLTLVLLAGGLGTAFANNFAPWTAIGSTGTPEPRGKVKLGAFGGEGAEVKGERGTAILRYNVTSVDGLLNKLDGWMLTVRYRDNGAKARVTVRLKRVNLSNGATSTIVTFDSNSFGQSSSVQERSIFFAPGCFSPFAFDFNNNAYFVEVELKKTAKKGKPAITAVQISSVLC